MVSSEEIIAEALFEDWKKSDKEILLTWETAPDHLKRVFLRKGEVAVQALIDGDIL